jgi:hypothetical protein
MTDANTDGARMVAACTSGDEATVRELLRETRSSQLFFSTLLIAHLREKKLQKSQNLGRTSTFGQIIFLELYKVPAMAQKMYGVIEIDSIHCQLTTRGANSPSRINLTGESP